MRWLSNFLRDQEGATAVEYAVMLALIILVCFGAVAAVGIETNRMMDPGGQLTGTLSGGGS